MFNWRIRAAFKSSTFFCCSEKGNKLYLSGGLSATFQKISQASLRYKGPRCIWTHVSPRLLSKLFHALFPNLDINLFLLFLHVNTSKLLIRKILFYFLISFFHKIQKLLLIYHRIFIRLLKAFNFQLHYADI
jgi:hypothetical protein